MTAKIESAEQFAWRLCPEDYRNLRRRELAEAIEARDEQIHAELEVENNRLRQALYGWNTVPDDVSQLKAYKRGVGDAFDFLGERRDERVMVLIQKAQAEIKRRGTK